MVICFLFYNRPIRLGLGVACCCWCRSVSMRRSDMRGDLRQPILFRRAARSGSRRYRMGAYRSLMHGSTHHGLNYQPKEYRRLATTYYHQYGPAGMVMKKFNWFQDGFHSEVARPRGG